MARPQLRLFARDTKDEANDVLAAHHYLGPTDRGVAYVDDLGVVMFANPASRRLPQERWKELNRWCLTGGKNAGTRQWARVVPWIRSTFPGVTTIVSYSDPSAGHSGALYRSCGWLWAPTWHRLRPPPSGNGDWGDGEKQATKDRWVFVLRRDVERVSLLAVGDEALMRSMPWASFREPAWKRGSPRQGTGGGDFKRWIEMARSVSVPVDRERVA